MILKVLKSPITIFVSMILGCLCGIYWPSLINVMSTFNNVYISLLTMIALPLIISAIVINIKKLFKEKQMLNMWVLLLLVSILITSIVGLGCSFLSRKLLEPDENAIVILNKINNKDVIDYINNIKIYKNNDVENNEVMSLTDFFIALVPDNIFKALADNRVLQVVLFCVVFGSMLSFIDNKLSSPIILLLEGVYEALYKFLDIVMLLMPFSLFVTMANIFIDKSVITLLPLFINFIIVLLVTMLVLMVISFLIIYKCTKCGFKSQIKAMKQTIITAIGTGSDLATTIVAMEDATKLGINKNVINLILPISDLMNPLGCLVSSIVIVMYAAIIYDLQINIGVLIIMVISSCFFAISASSMSTLVQSTMLSMILVPLGLPLDIVAILFILSAYICDSIETFCDVYPNIAIVSIIDRHMKNI